MKLNLSNDDGFTLLEALISLMLTSVILLLLTAGITQADAMQEVLVNDSEEAFKESNKIRGDRQIEWHLFLIQLERYLEGTKEPYVKERYFTVKEWDEERNRYVTVRYERRGTIENLTRSKLNGTNRMLTGIQELEFKQQGSWLLLDFQFKNGETYTGRIWVESWTEEEGDEIADNEAQNQRLIE